MTSKERFLRMYTHREADRIPIIDQPWAGTLRRWQNEGLPKDMDWTDYFDIDKIGVIHCDNSPRYEERVLEETDTYKIYTTKWGVTQKSFKMLDSTPEFLDYKVNTPQAWEEAKARMTFAPDRIDWKYLEENYPKWVAQGRHIRAHFWFGFDVTHSWMAGTETILVGMYEDPEWIMDIFDTYLRLDLECFQRVLDAGYKFDAIYWPDDMGYKSSMFFSNEMYREILKPFHKKAADWAHERGIHVHLHSCGDIMPRIDDLIDVGIDCLNPLEVKAGMQPLLLKEKYGKKLALHGGINAVLWDNREAIVEEIRRVVPKLKEGGGYIFSSDHSIPNSVSLENFRAIVAEVKKCGTY